MMMKRKTIKNLFSSFVAAALLIAAATPLPFSAVATAHEQKTAITQILFNTNSGNIEIAHRVNLHDAEHAVQDFWGEADLYSSPEDLDRLALYVRGNFFITLRGKVLELSPVGSEIDGTYVWVYDEVEIPRKRIKELTIENYILRDVWRDQANLVNLEIGDFRSSEFFSGEDEQKTIILEKKNQQ